MGYGFSVFRNSVDVCVLEVSTELEQRLERIEINLSERNGRHNDGLASSSRTGHMKQDLHWVRLRTNSGKASQRAEPAYQFSPHFLRTCSKTFANKREIAASDFCSERSVDFSEPKLSRNMLHVLCAVTMLLQKQRKAITQHNPKLPKWPESTRGFHAARYRRNQIHLLSALATHLLRHLQTLMGRNSLPGRDERVVRLEHILTQSPQGLLPDFRAALHAGLGTRNANNIRSKGWVECAFTIWLCGMWSWKVSQTEGLDGSQDTLCFFPVLSWLSFLERVYGHPDLTKADASPPTNDIKEVKKPTSAQDSKFITQDSDNVLVARSYLAVVEAARRKNPHSLYGGPDITIARLLWCLNVIREEGVMAPNLEGKPDEEDDEFILFLEVGDQ